RFAQHRVDDLPGRELHDFEDRFGIALQLGRQHDVPLDFCLDPANVIGFGARGRGRVGFGLLLRGARNLLALRLRFQCISLALLPLARLGEAALLGLLFLFGLALFGLAPLALLLFALGLVALRLFTLRLLALAALLVFLHLTCDVCGARVRRAFDFRQRL